MRTFLKHHCAIFLKLDLRSFACLILTVWMLLTSVGISQNGLFSVEKMNCQCDLRARQSQNCCCFPKAEQSSHSCCSKENQESTPEEDEGHPQLNSYCGLPVTNGILIDREPRLAVTDWDLCLNVSLQGVILFTNDLAMFHQIDVELPPPEFVIC